jgi:hypothetical protein
LTVKFLNHDNDINLKLCTFVSSIPIKTRSGRATDTTRASVQLVIKAITKLAMKVVTNCRKMATLSPIPE